MMDKRVFIFGHYGKNNIGDDAMLYALVSKIYELLPNCRITVFSPLDVYLPPETKPIVSITTSNPLIFFSELAQSDIFIMGGGTQIFDTGKKFDRLRILSEILVILLFAKIFCDNMWFLHIGVESFKTKWGNIIAKIIFNLPDFISVRDTVSFQILKRMNIKSNIALSFDLVALLDFPKNPDKMAQVKTLGISILPYFEIYYDDSPKDKILLSKLGDSLKDWVNLDKNNSILIFSFSRYDECSSRQLESLIGMKNQVQVVAYESNPFSILPLIGRCDAFIGMRYHSSLYSFLTETPLLIINYFEKCQSLAFDIGLPDFAVISIDEIMKGQFSLYLHNLLSNPGKFHAHLSTERSKIMAENGFPPILLEGGK